MEHDPFEAMLDRISDEVDELADRHPRRVLAQVLEDHAQTLPAGHVERAAWLTHAGEHWELARDLARARTCFEQAVEDGGPCWVDARALLLTVLLEVGESALADELLDELRHDAATASMRGPLHEYVGESLELAGRLEEALRWFNAGLIRGQQDTEEGDVGCLNGHYRVRRQLGLPHDRYDTLAEERRREALTQLDEEDDRRFTHAPAEPMPRLALLYWPPDEFERAAALWPSLRETHGADHSEHRLIVERHLRELARRGADVCVGPATVTEYVDFAEGKRRDPTDSATRAAYAAHLGFTGPTVPWPPSRNDRCWCGSGTKYKKCCGALRFADESADLP